VEIGHNRFNTDSERLIVAVERALGKAREQRERQEKERSETERREREQRERAAAEIRERQEKEQLDARHDEQEVTFGSGAGIGTIRSMNTLCWGARRGVIATPTFCSPLVATATRPIIATLTSAFVVL
jgi:hypothetical protein